MQAKKMNLLNKIIFLYFIFQIFFLRWFSGSGYISYIAIILAVILFFNKRIFFEIKSTDILIIFCFIFIVIINLINNGINPLFINNLYSQGIANLIIIVYIFIIASDNIEGLKTFILQDLFIIFNIYFIVNIPIIIKQLDYTYFLMRNVHNNPMYEDHITGLIGASGTHELTFYWIVLILINLYKYSQTKKKIIPIITSFYVIFMFIVSSQNDNTAFFILFPIIMGQFFIKDIINRRKFFVNIIKALLLVVVLGGISIYIYDNNADVNKFVNTRVLSKLEQFGLADRSVTSSDSDEERIALFKTALEIGNGYKLGCGIGSIKLGADPSLPPHFGMSEISSRTYEGGIIYLGMLILIFSHFLNRIFAIKIIKKQCISFIIIATNVTFFAIYTQIFRHEFYSFAMSLIVFIFSQHYNKNISNVISLPLNYKGCINKNTRS